MGLFTDKNNIFLKDCEERFLKLKYKTPFYRILKRREINWYLKTIKTMYDIDCISLDDRWFIENIETYLYYEEVQK